MPLYEHVIIARQDISPAQAEALNETIKSIIEEGGGSVPKTEYWGLRSLAYRMKKNRKGHYSLLNIDAPHPAVAEMERQMRLNEDVLRFLTLKVDELEEGESVMMRNRNRGDDRRGGRNDRGGPGGGRFSDDRGPREPREDRAPRNEPRSESKTDSNEE